MSRSVEFVDGFDFTGWGEFTPTPAEIEFLNHIDKQDWQLSSVAYSLAESFERIQAKDNPFFFFAHVGEFVDWANSPPCKTVTEAANAAIPFFVDLLSRYPNDVTKDSFARFVAALEILNAEQTGR